MFVFLFANINISFGVSIRFVNMLDFTIDGRIIFLFS